MDQWFNDVAKPTLFEALAAACGEIDHKLNAALAAAPQANNSDVAAELEALRAKAAQVDKLQQENTALRGQIQELGTPTASRLMSPTKSLAQDTRHGSAIPHTPLMRTPLASKSTNEALSTHGPSAKRPPPKPSTIDTSHLALPELRVEFSKLQDDYQSLYAKYTGAQNARAKLEQTLRSKVKALAEWQTQWNSLTKQSDERLHKIKLLKAKLAMISDSPQPESSRDASLAPGIGEEGHAIRADNKPGLARTDNSADDTNSSSTGSTRGSRPTMDVTQHPPTNAAKTADDQVDDYPALPPMPTEPTNKSGQATQVKSEPSSDPVVISEKVVRKRKVLGDTDRSSPAGPRIKNEPNSDPLTIDDSDKFAAHESMDLDADGQLIRTPKKHRHQQQGAPLMDVSDSKENQSHAGDSDGQYEAADLSVAKPVRDTLADHSSALHPLSVNVLRKRTLPLDVSGMRFRKRRSTNGLASLAEDGELYDNAQGHSTTSRDKSSIGVLHDLLHSHTPDRESIVHPGAIQTGSSTPTPLARTASPMMYQFPVPEKRPLPFGSRASKIAQSCPPKPQNAEHTTPRKRGVPVSSKNKPSSEGPRKGPSLRERPLSELKLTDFKVNPATNDGVDFAYTDIVRGRDERSKLPGDLSVYADEFRAQARAQRHSTSNLAFTSLLESWLGDNSYKLAEISAAEKERIWEDAKTAELAKMCGRVKHRFQRQRTPPGAWRTDFPSTQEEEQYREEARARDRQTVAERYREAMRPGGTWLFRDE
ncbi:uncharacterized protein B0I36DRAFT_156285 [Microdochium trichocladiopsis]|uniref:DNA endonuclease activator Ctp1 C-terminal domain-containing protein n=1 Tax=Microdochium trichocladiopsis TaxID=1682393 RepID=A0A9P9BMH2_9PEZI|nr:uncharacterized protein B0I36DRAFT_156285 [Microdochium trichocladiopsis]KAH7026275.1 hypothetical protein B0I36DRAFT_156285 [Microdochium trichocladiopsis]